MLHWTQRKAKKSGSVSHMLTRENLLYGNGKSIFDRCFVPLFYAALSFVHYSSYGRHDVDHLTADRACLTGGEVTVVAVLVEGNAYLVSCFHFELLQCLLCAGNKGLVACHSILLFLLVHCALISAAHILIGGVTNLHMIYIIEPESTDVLSGDRCFSFELCYYCEQSEGKYEWEIVTEKRIVLSNNKEDKLLFSGGRENLLRRRRCATSTECKPCFS